MRGPRPRGRVTPPPAPASRVVPREHAFAFHSVQRRIEGFLLLAAPPFEFLRARRSSRFWVGTGNALLFLLPLQVAGVAWRMPGVAPFIGVIANRE